MRNELLLLGSVVFIFSGALCAYRFFGKTGLYCVSVLATVLANIEVLILVSAFGMEQTLGNVLFAVTFLITDILSECEGKAAAGKAVWMGMFTSLFFAAQSELAYVHSQPGGLGNGSHPGDFFQYSQDADSFFSGVCGEPGFRRMALSQVVGFYREKVWRQAEVSLASEQWVHSAESAAEYAALYTGCVLGNL